MNFINTLKALSDVTRLRILSLLKEHELNVNEIVAVLNMGQSRISRHLKILADAGLVNFRKDGFWVFYRASESNIELMNLIHEKISMEKLIDEDQSALYLHIRDRNARGREYFNSVAGNWSDIRREITGDIDLNSKIVNCVDQCSIIADLGCGNGELIKLFLEKGKTVIGIDRSPRMLEEARKFLLRAGVEYVDLRLGELEHLPIREGEVDCAVISMVLHYLEDPLVVIEETGRVLKNGGKLIIVDTGTHCNEVMRTGFGHRWLGFSATVIDQWLIQSGFSKATVLEVETGRGMNINIFQSNKV